MLMNKEMWSEVKKHFEEFSEVTQAKIVGLAEHLDIEAEDVYGISMSDDECTFTIHTGDWLVCTDEEADEKAGENIEQEVWAFNTDFLLGFMPNYISESMVDACKERYEDSNDDILELIKAGSGLEKFFQDAIASDGRGHFLDLYSGEEEEIRVCVEENNQSSSGFDFYIYNRGN
jgi:hypothetical protein